MVSFVFGMAAMWTIISFLIVIGDTFFKQVISWDDWFLFVVCMPAVFICCAAGVVLCGFKSVIKKIKKIGKR